MQHAHNFGVHCENMAKTMSDLVTKKGSASHPYVQMLSARVADPTTHNLPLLADTAHHLCLMHAHFPGIIDHASAHITDNAARQWLIQASDGFRNERSYITRLSVSFGPAPSTAGQARNDASLLQMRHAIEMLGRSERRGCALGAALTLNLDWLSIRRLMDKAALRVGIEPTRSSMPTNAETLAIFNDIAVNDLVFRAVQFGGRQLLQQHNGLWDILENRAKSREEA